MEYIVVTESLRDLFENLVTAKLNNGWSLVGGVSVSSGLFAQAMSRERQRKN